MSGSAEGAAATGAPATGAPAPRPAFREALRVWLRIGVNSFGGPAGQIAVIHDELVVRRKWLDERRFLHALDLCLLLPGPEAQQLAVYGGWALHGVRGGLAAGILFVAPGALAMLALCVLYVEARDLTWFETLFLGVQSAVVALVALAIVRIAKRALRRPAAWVIGALSFVASFAFDVPFPLVVAAALFAGFALERARPGALRAPLHGTEAEGTSTASPPAELPLPPDEPPSLQRSLRTLATGLVVWLAPVALVVALDPGGGVQADMARFFTGASVVTFGGAYAALAYTADHAQGVWLSSAQMADGLALAESTPGPLVLVLQFVAFVGAHHNAGTLGPATAGILAAGVMLWTTFAPCFLWIFLCAPWMERLRASRALNAALASVTAAVVGVVADLAAWFALVVLFRETRRVEHWGARFDLPRWESAHLAAFALAALALALLGRARWPILAVLAACAAASAALRALQNQ